jgi:DnaJ family protein C protein 28
MSDEAADSDAEQESPAERRARMREDWSNLIEDLIEEGRQKGMFDDLPGQGKPLNLNKNPFGRESELAHNLLKQNDLAPAWITNRSQIIDEMESIRQAIQRAWSRHDHAFRYAQADSNRGALKISWDDACLEWQARINDLNKKIENFNLKRPSNQLEIFKLKLEDELTRAGAQRYLT